MRRPSGEAPFYRAGVPPTPAEGISKPPGGAATGRKARAYDAFMSHTSRIGRFGKLPALVLLALAFGPSLAWYSRCAACPPLRAAAHACCQRSASASWETGRWAPGCCGRLAAPTALAVREVQAQESLAAGVLPASEVRVPASGMSSDRHFGPFTPQRAVPLYTLFSALLI